MFQSTESTGVIVLSRENHDIMAYLLLAFELKTMSPAGLLSLLHECNRKPEVIAVFFLKAI